MLQGATFGTTAPQLQGAINGTVGPQGADATYVSGLNAPEPARQESANLEAALNILANGIEILGLSFGIGFCLRAVSSKKAKFASTLEPLRRSQA